MSGSVKPEEVARLGETTLFDVEVREVAVRRFEYTSSRCSWAPSGLESVRSLLAVRFCSTSQMPRMSWTRTDSDASTSAPTSTLRSAARCNSVRARSTSLAWIAR